MSGVLILVRHGRTAWNGERFLGRVDVPLDAVGRRQASRLVTDLEAVRIDAILTSPLLRTRDTAAPLARSRGLEPIPVAALSELDCGELQGQLKHQHGKLADRDPGDRFPGGESLADAHRRAASVARRVKRDLLEERTVVVVGHYVINQMLLGALRGLDPAQALAQPQYRPRPGAAYAWAGDVGIPARALGAGTAA